MTILGRVCDLVATLVLTLRTGMREENFIGYILQIQNIFILFNTSLIKTDIIYNMVSKMDSFLISGIFRNMQCSPLTLEGKLFSLSGVLSC